MGLDGVGLVCGVGGVESVEYGFVEHARQPEPGAGPFVTGGVEHRRVEAEPTTVLRLGCGSSRRCGGVLVRRWFRLASIAT